MSRIGGGCVGPQLRNRFRASFKRVLQTLEHQNNRAFAYYKTIPSPVKWSRRAGRIVVLRQPVTTSSRRFLQRGIVRTIATNWLIWLLYLFGVSPHRLARLYRQVR